VFPGISRSGITISAGLFAGFRREEAGEFSFLLSIPAILGAAVLKIGDLGDLSGSIGLASLSAGMLASLLSGLGALLALMSLVRRGKLHYFAFYLIPLGLIGLIFL
jgi:undecaprenyl-diphosphatase